MPRVFCSLVFSSWRLTLDFLARLLSQRGIPFLQIDGRNGGADRQKKLTAFREDASIPVLLMSIDVGSVGLVNARLCHNLVYIHSTDVRLGNAASR
jgi:superfamily II DNA/RNA helicase